MNDQKEKQIGQAALLSLIAESVSPGDIFESVLPDRRIMLSSAGYDHWGHMVTVLLQRPRADYPDPGTIMYIGPCKCSQCSMHYTKMTYHTVLRSGIGEQVVYSVSSNSIRDLLHILETHKHIAAKRQREFWSMQ
jgi:hypothetical protein